MDRCEVCYGLGDPLAGNVICDYCMDKLDWEPVEKDVEDGEFVDHDDHVYDTVVRALVTKFSMSKTLMRIINIFRYGPMKQGE